MQFPTLEQITNQLAIPLLVLVILMVVDLVTGVLVAVVRKQFTTEKLTAYLESDFLPIVLWIGLRIVLFLPAQYFPSALGAFDVIVTGAYLTVFAKIGGSILGTSASVGILTNQVKKIGVIPKAKGGGVT